MPYLIDFMFNTVMKHFLKNMILFYLLMITMQDCNMSYLWLLSCLSKNFGVVLGLVAISRFIDIGI